MNITTNDNKIHKILKPEVFNDKPSPIELEVNASKPESKLLKLLLEKAKEFVPKEKLDRTRDLNENQRKVEENHNPFI